MAQVYAALCQRCSQLLIQVPASPTDYATTYHNSIQECKEGAMSACAFCRYILDSTLGNVLADDASMSRLGGICPPGAKMAIKAYGDPPMIDITVGPFVIAKNLRIYTLPDDPLAPVLGGRPFTDGAASPDAYAMVNSWINQCASQHEECNFDKATELPTRVLDVSHDQWQGVRLFVPKHHDLSVGQYTALSYCWGTTPCVKTTSLSLSDHLENISFVSLPGTIQDAICITRTLDIRFLWVDALCIIQGQDEAARKDWEAESSKMGTVYSNAFVTLSAAGAPNCQAGMFFPRSPRLASSFRFLAYDRDSMEGGYVYLDMQIKTFSLNDEEPIDKRAWTLQERLLSPRLVKYGTNAISWECRSATLAEFDARVRTDGLKIYRLPRQLTTDDWMQVIEDYSSRNITFVEDRIPAIFGMVRHFQRSLNMRYVAGLWASESDPTVLLRLLIWHVVLDTEEQRNNMKRLPGPTWSWLSVNAPVSWRYPPVSPGKEISLRYDTKRAFVKWQADVIECHVKQDESDPLCRVTNGCITIRGVLKQIKALGVGRVKSQLCILDPPEDADATRGLVEFDFEHDFPFQDIGGGEPLSCIVHGKNGAALPSCLYLTDLNVKDMHGITAPCGILVIPDRESPQQWRKVGVFSLSDYLTYSGVKSGWLDDGVLAEIELV